MAPRKRISRIASRTVAPSGKKENCITVATQTDIVGRKPGGQLKRVKMTAASKQLSDSRGSTGPPLPISESITTPVLANNISRGNDKMCQTMEQGSIIDGRVGDSRGGFGGQLNHLKTIMMQRRAEAIDLDRQRLATLIQIINSDPPPCWQAACQMWLELDKLETRIELYEATEMLIYENRENESPGSEPADPKNKSSGPPESSGPEPAT